MPCRSGVERVGVDAVGGWVGGFKEETEVGFRHQWLSGSVTPEVTARPSALAHLPPHLPRGHLARRSTRRNKTKEGKKERKLKSTKINQSLNNIFFPYNH